MFKEIMQPEAYYPHESRAPYNMHWLYSFLFFIIISKICPFLMWSYKLMVKDQRLRLPQRQRF